ncbi:hypothetical protein GGI04_000222 [Coemansia thaxteri]|nr:hypothetical protein GGI04_000222 [Coemansia thaxteri]KAJ2474202.1 hypothetical protein GGI02_000247 [Coemansia sp. RSA 2322]
MHIGENGDGSGSMAGPPGRHRLSFGEQGSRQRQAFRRRVFAHLAPHEAGEVAGDRAGDSSSDNGSDSDGLEVAQSAPIGLEADGGTQAAREALAQFGQRQRQRFMRQQRILDSAAEREAAEQQHFPSNDVDSYWYNQPAQELPLPAVSRSQLAEESRRAMLQVLQVHDGSSSGGGSGGLDRQHQRLAQHQRWIQHRLQTSQPSWMSGAAPARRSPPERAPDKTAAAADGASHSSGSVSRLAAATAAQYTVAARALDCALLRPGMSFVGTQRISPETAGGGGGGGERWDVHVAVQTVDMRRGRVTGLMKAINVPRMPQTVVTYWEGEVIDFSNHTPRTAKWRAERADDARHWLMFQPLRADAQAADAFLAPWPSSCRGKRMPRFLEDYIFMRWKEESFVNVRPSETGLTIAGFYYVCMNRCTGEIEGKCVYFDPASQPYQYLMLRPENGGHSMAFASAECC